MTDDAAHGLRPHGEEERVDAAVAVCPIARIRLGSADGSFSASPRAISRSRKLGLVTQRIVDEQKRATRGLVPR